MIYEEDIARQKLSLVVDNSERRQIPYPAPWYERWFWLGAIAVAALCGAYLAAMLLFSFE